MARDVEFNMTASDRTGPAFDGVARKSEQTQEKIRKDSEKTSRNAGDSWVKGLTAAAPRVLGAVTSTFEQAQKASGPILGAVGVAAAPIIAGTLSAAIIGGAGIGGVIGGVALVKDDPRVAAAGADLGKTITSDLKDFARPFVEPVIRGIDTIKSRFAEVEGPLRGIFARSSAFVAPLVNGVTRFAQGLIRGIDTLASKAGPVINRIDSGLEQLGGDVDKFFTTISRGSEGAAVSVGQLFDLFGGALAVLGPLINGINQINAGLDRMGLSPGILQLVGKYAEANDATGTFVARTQGATEAVGAQGAAAQTTAADLDALQTAIRGNVDANVALYGSATDAAKAIADSTEAIETNGAGLALNTEKGRENREVLQNLAASLNANYDAYVQVNGAGEGAQEVLRNNREAFIRVATAAAGSSAKARALADDLLGIPSVKPKVELLDNASGKVNNVINRLAAVKSKTVSLTVLVRQSGDAAALRKQSLPSGLSAAGHYAQTTGEGRYRTGGPTPVNLSNSLQVTLDGQPFYDYTARAIREDRARADWRAKVGTRP